MINVGNTCYLNSTLQALFHVPAFANWLISDSLHRETCEEKSKHTKKINSSVFDVVVVVDMFGVPQANRPHFYELPNIFIVSSVVVFSSSINFFFASPHFSLFLSLRLYLVCSMGIAGMQNGCIICAMAKTLITSQQANSQPFRPYFVYSKLKLVCKHLVLGHQEDAHEFLRYLMEAMEKAYLARYTKSSQLDQYSQETTPINQILGGYLKTSVRCLSCHHISVTFQHFEDLLLDIRKANTLDEALDLYFGRERLEDMGYKCESCKKKVSATKQYSLERAPISLCIQLKRFSIMGNKLNKHIAIRQHLNLSRFASRRFGADQLNYRLVSMITHLGTSQNCGHYTAIGYTGSGSYYQFDDSFVRVSSLQSVLSTNAYIMFYELETAPEKLQTIRATNVLDTNKVQGLHDKRPINYVERDVAETPMRNNVSQTVTSKAFIGPLLPTGKMSTAISGSDTTNDFISTDLTNKAANGKSSESYIPAINFTSIADMKSDSYTVRCIFFVFLFFFHQSIAGPRS